MVYAPHTLDVININILGYILGASALRVIRAGTRLTVTARSTYRSCWGPHGVGGPAPICTLDVRKLKVERIYDSTSPVWIIEVLDSIMKFHLVQLL